MDTIQKVNRLKKLEDDTLTSVLIKDTEVKWHSIFDAIKDSILLLDSNGKILMGNRASEVTFGVKIGNILGRQCHEVVHNSNCFIDSCPFVKMKLSKQRETMILPLNDKWFDVIVDPILDNKNEVAGAVHIVIDISEIKRSELIIELQNKQLRELNSAKDKFFSIISHDLRSPFQDLISLTELLTEGVEDLSNEDLSRLASRMHSNAKGLLKLLSNLLDWARMQQGMTRFEPEEIHLLYEVSQNINLIIQRGEQKNISLTHFIPHVQKVYADKEMLNGILRNLLSNAIKFTSEGGKVSISSKIIENGFVEISIKDTGIGMSRELKNKLFKIDERVGRRGTHGEVSSGLGLLICKEFVEKHGGKIWVESIQNAGSTFYFTLPVMKDIN